METDPGAQGVGNEEGDETKSDQAKTELGRAGIGIGLVIEIVENPNKAGEIAEDPGGPVDFRNHGESLRRAEQEGKWNRGGSGRAGRAQLQRGRRQADVPENQFGARRKIMEFKADGVGAQRQGRQL